MREAVGGTLLLKIVLVFLVIYIGFMAVVISYGRIFRIKNKLINTIEQNEGFEKKQDIEDAAKSLGYLSDVEACYVKRSNDKGYYYKVKIYIDFQIPLIKNTLKIPVTGETRTIDTGNVVPQSGWECD